MKRIFIFGVSIFILTLSANGQTEALINVLTGKQVQTLMENIIMDTIPKVVYAKTKDVGKPPAYYINGIFASPTIVKSINPQLVDSVHIDKKEIEIDGKVYYGQIFIKMKEGYNPQIISLSDLVKKYTNLKNEIVIFMIDNELIKDDYEKYIVDEKYIFKIIVDTIGNVDVVRLLTRFKENIDKSTQIRIRGLEEVLN